MYHRTIYLSFLLIAIFSQALEANQGLQRLFMTAQERTALDKTRSDPPKTPPTGGTNKGLSPDTPRYVTFNGLVTRSNGPPTAWINGSNELLQRDFTVELDQRDELLVPIILSDSNQTIFLKPGQTVNILDGIVKDYFVQPTQVKK